MSFRSKCTNCGRRQAVSDEEMGRSVWCNACGGRFDALPVDASDLEPAADGSVIPVIDFPLTPAPPVVKSANVLIVGQPAKPPVSAIPSLDPLPISPAADTTPRPYVTPSPIVLPSISTSMIPLGIAVVMTAGLMLAIGVFFLGEWFGGHRQTAHASPMPVNPPVSVSPVSSSDAPTAHPATRHASETAKPIATALVPQAQPVDRPKVQTPKPYPEVAKNREPAPPPKFHPVPAALSAGEMDDQIGKSIDRGVDFLLSQFNNGQLRQQNGNSGMAAGMDALAVYALLQAGEATHDPRLGPSSTLVAQMLDELKKLQMDHEDSTYARALRCAALGVYHRADDKNALKADCAWLITDSNNGAFTYEPVPAADKPREPTAAPNPGQPFRRREFTFGNWDNSNSQYGALGVWAALEAGVEVPTSFWQAVQKHWLGCQLPNGEWAYMGYGDMGRLSMTVAGITTLLVTEDQLDARTVVNTFGRPPFTPALQKGLNWLEAGNNSVRLPVQWRTYNLFGLERAALASGFKYFGDHDWYRELAKEQLALQEPNGSWIGSHPIVDTSYTLLFLSRGRHPIFFNKLRFDTNWANRPRDIANLSHYASTVLERPVNWQVVSLKSDWSDWMDSPVLYIASHEALNFSDQDITKLRTFAQNGGLIFTHADGDAPAFNKSIAELSKRLFPDYPLTDLPTTHPIFSTLYKIKSQPRLQGISNGSRLLLLHSPTDLNKTWQQRDWVQRPASFQMGINIFIYAAGKANLQNKLKTSLVPEPSVTPILTTQLARLKYPGDCNPEPAAWPRFARMFLANTSIKLDLVEVDPLMLDPKKMPVAQLSGTIAVHYDTTQLRAIQTYVDNGGILLIDACGGSEAFSKSMFIDFLPHAFPKTLPGDLHQADNILAGTGDGMTRITLKLRPWRTETDGESTQPLQVLKEGAGMVILSSVDITTGLLGTNTWPINGYTPETCYGLVRNIVLSAIEK